MKKSFCLLLCAVLSACGGGEFEKMVKRDLKDPDSAQFRETVRSNELGLACIEWNAKNSFGGYGGWKVAQFEKVEGRWAMRLMEAHHPCDEASLRLQDDARKREAKGDAAAEAARIEAIKLWAKGRGMSEAYSEKLMSANPDCVSLLSSYSWNARAIETDHLAKAAKKLTDAGVKFPDDSYGRALANPPSKGKAAEMAAQRRILETGVCKRN